MTELSHIDTRVSELMNGYILPTLNLTPASWLTDTSWRTTVADRIEDWLGMLVESKRILWELPVSIRTLQGLMSRFGQVTRDHETRLRTLESPEVVGVGQRDVDVDVDDTDGPRPIGDGPVPDTALPTPKPPKGVYTEKITIPWVRSSFGLPVRNKQQVPRVPETDRRVPYITGPNHPSSWNWWWMFAASQSNSHGPWWVRDRIIDELKGQLDGAHGYQGLEFPAHTGKYSTWVVACVYAIYAGAKARGDEDVELLARRWVRCWLVFTAHSMYPYSPVNGGGFYHPARTGKVDKPPYWASNLRSFAPSQRVQLPDPNNPKGGADLQSLFTEALFLAMVGDGRAGFANNAQGRRKLKTKDSGFWPTQLVLKVGGDMCLTPTEQIALNGIAHDTVNASPTLFNTLWTAQKIRTLLYLDTYVDGTRVGWQKSGTTANKPNVACIIHHFERGSPRERVILTANRHHPTSPIKDGVSTFTMEGDELVARTRVAEKRAFVSSSPLRQRIKMNLDGTVTIAD